MLTRTKVSLGGLVLGFFLLGSCYAVFNFPGNSPDEPSHRAYALYWAKSGALPVFERSPYWPRYTALHPPLYYGVLRLFVPWAKGSPARDQVLLFRLLGVLFHGLSLIAIFSVGSRVFGSVGAGWGGALFAGLNPMFSFMGASVNNDVAANFFSAAMLAAALACLEKKDARRLALLAVFSAAAVWSKMTAVVPAFVLWGAAAWGGERRPRPTFLMFSFFLALTGPLFARNLFLYGDPLAAAAFYKVEPVAAGIAGLPAWFMGSYESFFARFGWMTVFVGREYYTVLWVLGFLSVAGLLADAQARRAEWRSPPRLTLAAFALTVLAQGAWYGATSLQQQGRYLFIGMAALAPLFAHGLRFWVDRTPLRARPWAWISLVLFAFFLQGASLKAIAESFAIVPGLFNPRGVG